jgi:phage repressor protein C with HTH and peptisase S24 domain
MRFSTAAPQMTTSSKQNQASRLAYLRETMGFTVRQVGEAVGRSSSRVTNWESDPNIKIKNDVLEKLAKLYHVTPEFIRYGETGSPPPYREMARAVSAIREPNSFEVVGPVTEQEYLELPFIGPLAYGSFAVNCQDFSPEDGSNSTYSVLKIDGIDYKKAVVLEIRGNSMAPRYPERSKHVIRPVSDGNWQYAQGVHAIALQSEMFLIKRIISNQDGILTLSSDNGGSTMTVTLGDINCMWKVGEAVYMPAED